MGNLSLKQLRYFEAVAELKHFGKAAERCAVSQPALSMQIKELEAALGASLIERRRDGALLTPAGEEIYKRSRAILSAVRDMAEYAQTSAKGASGRLNLGVIPSLAPYLLAPALPLIKQRHPSLDLHIRETLTEPLLAHLQEGALDALLLALPIDAPEIETTALFEDRFLLALPAAAGRPKQARATLDLVRGQNLILLEEGHCLRDQTLAFCQLRDKRTQDAFGASSLATIAQMVANGVGATVLPEISLAAEAQRPGLRVMRFEEPQPSRVIGLAWRASSPRKAAFEALGATLAAAAASLTG